MKKIDSNMFFEVFHDKQKQTEFLIDVDFEYLITEVLEQSEKTLAEWCEALREYNYDNAFISQEVYGSFVHYENAMDFLRKNDNSLTETLEQVYMMGLDLKNLNSCTLAGILEEKYIMEEFEELINGMME